jgi:DNA repair protein RadC
LIITSARDAFDVFKPAFSEAPPEESTLAVAFLDKGRQLIDLSVLGSSAGGEAGLPVRRIVEAALTIGASGLVTAQRRPAGDAQPTWEDLESVRELAETLARLGIRMHDHLIVAGEETCSLRALGLL